MFGRGRFPLRRRVGAGVAVLRDPGPVESGTSRLDAEQPAGSAQGGSRSRRALLGGTFATLVLPAAAMAAAPGADAEAAALTVDRLGAANGVAELDGTARLPAGRLPVLARSRATLPPAEHLPQRLGAFAQSEIAFNVRDFGAVAGGADETSAIQSAIDAASRYGGMLVFPPGEYRSGPLVISRPIKIVGASAGTARFRARDADATGVQIPWHGVQITRNGTSTAPLLTISSHAVVLENMCFSGNNQAGDGIAITTGFEIRMKSTRVVYAVGVGLRIDFTNNSRFEHVMIDNCGTASLPGMSVNSIGGLTNTIDFAGLTVERSRGTAIAIGDGADEKKYWAEFLRFSDLHIENPADTGGWANPLGTPLVKIGNARDINFHDAFVYGGPGVIVSVMPSVWATGIQFVGGTLLGKNPALTDPAGVAGSNASIIEIGGVSDNVKLVGTRLQRYTGPAITVGPDVGAGIHVDSSVEFIQEQPLLDDKRKPERNPSIYRTHGHSEIRGEARVSGAIAFGSRLTSTQGPSVALTGVSNAPAPQGGNRDGGRPTAALPSVANDVRGIVHFGSASKPAAGAQVTVKYSAAGAPRPVVVISPCNARTAQLELFVTCYADCFVVGSATAPAAGQAVGTYVFTYQIIN